MGGLFITLEGGEGTGKTTQQRRLANRLTALGRDVTATREPGGSEGGEAVRGLLVSGDPGRWSPNAEALLIYAARDSHLRDKIRPALEEGAIVICDRFLDSTRVYQGLAGQGDGTLLDHLEQLIIGATRPQLTLIFDMEPGAGLARARARGGGAEDRFERKGIAFHRSLRDAFRDIAAQEPDRCKLIDAAGSEDAVAEAVWRAVEPWL